jgi:hypothetical protein
VSGTQVDFGTLERIQRTLTTASGGLEDCGGGSPTSVDGGDLSSLITSMIAKVTESAGGLSEGLSAAAGQVAESSASYAGSDDRSAQGLGSQRAR